MRSPTASAAITWRSAWRGCASLAPQARFVGLSATVADPPALARFLSPARRTRSRSSSGEPGAQPEVAHHRCPRARCPGPATWPSRGARGLQHHPPAQDLARVRQHARPGRARLRGAVAHQRRQPADRPAPRLARRRAAPQGRGGDGGGQAARRGRTSSLDLGIDWGDVDLVIQMGAPKGVSRLMQRIGRANHRLDEPSRAVLVPANRFEVLECWRRSRPSRRASSTAIRRGRPASTCWRSTSSASPAPSRSTARRSIDEVRSAAALSRPAAQGFRRHVRLRRHRRLCAGGLRALAPAEAAARRALDAGLAAGGAAVPHECRHHRRAAADEGEAAARAGAGRGRGILRPGARAGRHLRLRRPAAALRGHRTSWWRNARRRPAAIPRCRPMAAAGCRSRPSWPTACAASCRIPSRHPKLPAEVREWLRIQRCRSALPNATSCWSRPSRAAAGTSSSPTASRAATRTRRWACC